MIQHDVAWVAPQPFWTDAAGAVAPKGDLARPQILRFANDEFIPQLLAQLQQDPAALPQYRAGKETWRGPAGAPAPQAQQWIEQQPRRMLSLKRLVQKRERAANPVVVAPPKEKAPFLKLYQPAHLRHYLVSGSLICRKAGLPDRHVEPGRQKVSFVLRRLFPAHPENVRGALPEPTDASAADWHEYAYLPQGKGGLWSRVGLRSEQQALARPVRGEERLGTFPANFTQDDGHARRLFIGSVPVGRREAYQAATFVATDSADLAATGRIEAADPRLALFESQVLARWKAMVNQVTRTLPHRQPDASDTPLSEGRPDFLFDMDDDFVLHRESFGAKALGGLLAARSALLTSSWYLLLDLRDYLTATFGAAFLQQRPAGAAGLLYDALAACELPDALTGNGALLSSASEPASFYHSAYRGAVKASLIDALVAIDDWRLKLEGAKGSFSLAETGTPPADWPNFAFPFADPWFGVLLPPEPTGFHVHPDDYLAEKLQARIGALSGLVQAALAEAPPATDPLPDAALNTLVPGDMREGWYVMRLVYECPGCEPFHAPVVSAPTQPFQMAGFFDPDAPARPVRIGLPLDISPAGLRKFDKNTVFMLSDMLCGQIDRMKGLTLADLVLSVLPWPFHKDLNIPEKGDCKSADGDAIGVMCSLSIPIVTICALLLLMIIVSLLDFVFRWMPYFITCFPLPGFKGRKES